MKYLVIRLSSIGDIVLTTPVIRCLKQQVEGVEIHYVVKKKHACILKANPYITKIYTLGEKLSDLMDDLNKVQFDYIIDLHQNIRSNRIKSRIKIPAFSFNKLNYQKWLIVNLKINKLPNKHVVDRYIETLSVFDVKNDNKGLDYFIPEEDQFDFQKLPQVFGNGYIAFVIAGTYYTKKLPNDKILEICKQTDKPVILLGGNEETTEGELIAAMYPERVINFCGKTTLGESADIVKNAKIVLSNDTGLMHIAAAFKKKILSFWGNTIPEFGMLPYLPDSASKIMENNDLNCRPCSKLGFDKCPKKHFNCMANLNQDEIQQWIETNY
ncbi:MAG: glycosyltransferase family 9 protein [Mariniphaga sp.]|nr:glycosyltransferase family 9 protein [Mariniphaga sp.]